MSLTLSSCVALQEGTNPVASLSRNASPSLPPEWAKGRICDQWWTVYQDPQLNNDVATALAQSPDLAVLAHRLEQSEAGIKTARAAAWPRLNLGFGYRPGRARDVDFGPYDMAPWQGTAQFQWELDLWGKLKHLRQSASAARNAAFYDREAARLLLSTRIAGARFRLYRLKEEKRLLTDSIDANAGILKILTDREKAGIIANTELLRAKGEHEKLKRGLLELERLEQLALSELLTLRGRSGQADPSGNLPNSPLLPSKSFDQLLRSHPTLIASEMRVRRAFQLQESTRLNLLPSITLSADATGRSAGFLLNDYRQWKASVGPTLDIPVFDPARLAALDKKKAETNEAASQYRSSLVQILEEIETSYLNWANRKQQLATVQGELASLEEARENVRATFRAGLVSQVAVLEAERSTLEAARARVVLRQALLNDHVALIRALGGGK